VSKFEDDGHAIAFGVLRRGTPVRSSDGAVTTTFPAVEAAQYFEEASNPALQRLGMSTTVRRSKRAANRVRDRFGRQERRVRARSPRPVRHPAGARGAGSAAGG